MDWQRAPSSVAPVSDAPAVIDFVNLTSGPEPPLPEDFPAAHRTPWPRA
ncbi:hypothetical protein [Streptomyces sp. NPDC006463]